MVSVIVFTAVIGMLLAIPGGVVLYPPVFRAVGIVLNGQFLSVNWIGWALLTFNGRCEL